MDFLNLLGTALEFRGGCDSFFLRFFRHLPGSIPCRSAAVQAENHAFDFAALETHRTRRRLEANPFSSDGQRTHRSLARRVGFSVGYQIRSPISAVLPSLAVVPLEHYRLGRVLRVEENV